MKNKNCIAKELMGFRLAKSTHTYNFLVSQYNTYLTLLSASENRRTYFHQQTHSGSPIPILFFNKWMLRLLNI